MTEIIEEGETKNKRRVTTNTPALLSARKSFSNSRLGNIINVLLDMKSNGYSEYTLNFVSKALSFLAKHADLNNAEAVKLFISEYSANNS
jgi:hypothetical protein